MRQASITLFSLLLLLVTACQSESPEKNTAVSPAKEVKTIEVKAYDYQETVYATGRLSSTEEAKLSFKTGGIIRKIYVREGQSVRKGQLLAELTLDEIKAQTQQASIGQQQADINIDNAKLALKLAQRDYDNALGLYQDSVATLEQLQNAEVQLENAKNQLEAAQKGKNLTEQQFNVAQFNLRFSRITAPSDGVILKKLAENNELVGPGNPVFLFGSEDKSQVIKVNVTDKDIIYVELGNPATIQFDAYPEVEFKGAVREKASMADPYTGTYEVEVEVQPEGEKLYSGFIGQVRIYTGSQQKLVVIPVDALLKAHGQAGEVFIVDDSLAKRTHISIYKIEDQNLLISKGLLPGDQVITSGAGFLNDDEPVKLANQ
jgi:RND family efflux transporter MFP subunit